ncbi:MAG: indole-3-glycerol-phosphate synthase [Pseudomonadota bacterium]
MSDFLANMASASAARDAAARPQLDTLVQAAKAARRPVPFPDRPFAIIAEIKRVSPAEGALGVADDIVARARRYAAGGAAAISVLTEPQRFGGSLDDLARVAAALPATPVMRKDFIVGELQLYEARAAGASGVLLIAAMLDDAALLGLSRTAVELGLFVLLEAFDGDDLDRLTAPLAALPKAVAAGQVLVGVNTRNLRTLAVDSERLPQLAAQLPKGVRAIAESGIASAADAAGAAQVGYTGALIGTALMRASDPARLLDAMQTAAAGASL